ncbi:Tubulin-specific chaperone D [Schistosoma japonicum]|nr:Tubulin-specific chaperone D [Schistosoma japonicum]
MCATVGDLSEEKECFIFTEFKHFDQIMKLISDIKLGISDLHKKESIEETFVLIFNFYQEQPHLLDPYLEKMISACLDIVRCPLTEPEVLHFAFRILYLMIKTRGYKAIIHLMPHTVDDIEPSLNLLMKQDIDNSENWKTRYVLMLWLSILVMVPFNLEHLDNLGREPIVERIIDLAKLYLSQDERTQEAAAFLLAHTVTRPDTVCTQLPLTILWAIEKLKCSNLDNMRDEKLVSGILRSIANICKLGCRTELLLHANDLLDAVLQLSADSSAGILLCRLKTKVLQRIGLLFCPPLTTAWQYQRGCRSLQDNLESRLVEHDKKTNPLHPSVSEEGADHLSRIDCQSNVGNDINKDCLINGNSEFPYTDEVAEVIDKLIYALRSQFTGVRWSSAKGIGRICSRLSGPMVDDVLSAVLSLCTKLEPYAAWHGACLALAELGRRIVLRALFYDERSGDHNYGSNVRDAGCYVCWAFARAYHPKDFENYVVSVASSLVLVSLFDREVSVRRAASAAFQENVGRQGQFPHGIEILTTCDYFSVGNRSHCYLQLSVAVAKYKEYVKPMIDHLSYLRSLMDLLNLLYIISKGLRRNNKFHGLSGELIRKATAHFIQKCSMAKLPFHDDPVIEVWREFLDDCVGHKNPEVQKATVNAYPYFLSTYLYSRNGELKVDYQGLLYRNILLQFNTSSDSKLSGYLQIVGSAPHSLYCGHVSDLFDILICACKPTSKTKFWIESRGSALKALVDTIRNLGSHHSELDVTLLKSTCNVLLQSLSDYTTDSRGDVGSHVREVGMTSIHSFIKLLVNSQYKELVTSELIQEVMINIAQQAVEKIDRTRGVAGQVFAQLLHHDPPIEHMPHFEELKRIFPKSDCDNMIWISANSTFPYFVKLLDFPEYRYRLILGLVVSVGGLTELTIRSSTAALSAYFLEYESDQPFIMEVLEIVEQILQSFRHEDSSILLQLIESVWSETKLSKDVQRIKAAIDVFSGMLQFAGRIRKRSLSLMMVTLGSRYPLVRKATATELYECLLVHELCPPEVVRPIRNQLCELFQVPVPSVKSKS